MKKIVHIDMDCFYAAVEMRDDPSLESIPLAIGGSEKRRGVISTCNYIARKHGVRSAMATAHALRLCPNLTVIRGNMMKYKEVSQHIREIFSRYTDKIEPLSLDEAYLDVTDSELYQGSATLIAEAIRADIARELRLTASAGVGPVKFVAKVASDINKPDGICVIPPNAVDDFVKTLPLEKIPGVGKVTLTKLHKLGLYTGSDVQQFDKAELIQRFGKFGHSLWKRSHGVDDREVETHRERKSVGVERTLAADVKTEAQCLEVLESLYTELEKRLCPVLADRKINRQGVKLKFSDFQQTTVEHRQDQFNKTAYPLLLKEALERQQGRGIRLIGLTVGLAPKTAENREQLSFDWG
ncbi:DNA polymerase IV [Veronia nyctiphanis]|uniref:DNA polymerase IV n=1 Tax=Veronia nyctiphanis TaxID=1278244 RepID=A0A4Q0YQ27_9GAMM|nr:DNA polymerase IV [Veronia nyctiphanis]RXJ73102.1 DNA polymerase IV [Veronia nyctiphanis]